MSSPPDPELSTLTGDPWWVEIGSGSVKWRLATTGDDGHDASTLTKATRHLGLTTEINDAGVLSDHTSAELDAVLAELAGIRDSQGLGSPTVVACEVLRRAPGARVAVADRVERHLGASLVVLTPEQEAGLALRGAMAARSSTGPEPLVIMDVGSASTELATGIPAPPDRADGDTAPGMPGEQVVASFSMPLGGHTVADSYLVADPPDPGELSAALSVIELHLDDLRRDHHELARAIDNGVMVGMGAFVQIAAVEAGIDISAGSDPVDGYVLERDAAEEVFRALATESRADRVHNPGLLAQHLDGVVGALCIVVEFLRQFSIDSIEVTSAEVLDGLAAELTGNARLGL